MKRNFKILLCMKNEIIQNRCKEYLETRKDVFGERKDKFVCLMDLALIAMRKLKKEGKLDDQEKSDEINACSIVVPVEVDPDVVPPVEEEVVDTYFPLTHPWSPL